LIEGYKAGENPLTESDEGKTKPEVIVMFPMKCEPKGNLESFFDSLDRDALPMLRPWFRVDDDEGFRMPLVNINESEKEFVVTVELPGVQKKDLDVSIDGEQLVVTAERSEKVESNEGLLRREIRSEKFRRSFTLGQTVDRDTIKAKLENGILKVTLPKKAESVGRKLDIS
jgi:HSP20 family protein